jgi:cytochrome oxidase Cu insertion factor (SCO1/SenC/PrrC family)
MTADPNTDTSESMKEKGSNWAGRWIAKQQASFFSDEMIQTNK